jgi:hypothetical protein
VTLPTSSIPITAGAGTVTAAHLLGGKYYGTPMRAGDRGHIIGTRPSFLVIIPSVAGTAPAANKVHWDLFNATGSGVTLEVHGIYAGFNSDVAIAQALGIRLDLFRTTDIGSGGATVGTESTTAINTFSAIDPADVGTKPAGVTCRVAPTGGATTGAWMGQTYLTTEEVSTNYSYYSQFQNIVRYEQMDDMRQLTLPEDSGIKLVQGPVNITAGQLNFRIVFTWY